MKNVFLISLILLVHNLLHTQITQAFNYQAVVRDAQGNPSVNTTMNFEVSLVQNNSTVYAETQSKTTNAFGLVDLNVGQGSPTQGNLTNINWGTTTTNIRVRVNGTSLPEKPILPVPMALYALKSGGSAADSWTTLGNNIYRVNGNIGIGTSVPISKLHVEGDFRLSRNGKSVTFELAQEFPNVGRSNSDGILYYEINGNEYHMFGGNIIGDVASRDVGSTAYPWNNLFAKNLRLRDGNREFVIDFKQNFPGIISNDQGVVYYEVPGREYHVFGGNIMTDDSQSHGIGLPNLPIAHAYIRGLTRTGVLEITGGDVAEARHTTTGKPLPKGSVVVFDENGSGKVQLTTKPYDKKVAGVISGAGKYFAGVTLLQEELAKGAQPVAQIGTVEVLVVGPVEVGDLLTTSKVEGHAMAAKNKRKAVGSIIGKATSPLKAGERGLVEMQVEKH